MEKNPPDWLKKASDIYWVTVWSSFRFSVARKTDHAHGGGALYLYEGERGEVTERSRGGQPEEDGASIKSISGRVGGRSLSEKDNRNKTRPN